MQVVYWWLGILTAVMVINGAWLSNLDDRVSRKDKDKDEP